MALRLMSLQVDIGRHCRFTFRRFSVQKTAPIRFT